MVVTRLVNRRQFKQRKISLQAHFPHSCRDFLISILRIKNPNLQQILNNRFLKKKTRFFSVKIYTGTAYFNPHNMSSMTLYYDSYIFLPSWTKIIAHLKYEDIDSLFPQVLKILTPPFPHSMLHMIWANANSLPQHCVGERGV